MAQNGRQIRHKLATSSNGMIQHLKRLDPLTAFDTQQTIRARNPPANGAKYESPPALQRHVFSNGKPQDRDIGLTPVRVCLPHRQRAPITDSPTAPAPLREWHLSPWPPQSCYPEQWRHAPPANRAPPQPTTQSSRVNSRNNASTSSSLITPEASAALILASSQRRFAK